MNLGSAKSSSGSTPSESSGRSGSGSSVPASSGISSGPPSIPGGSGSSGSSAPSSSLPSALGCALTLGNSVLVSENEFIFGLVNSGVGPVDVTDMGFDVATPVFDPPAPFTIPEGGFVVVTMTTVLPNTGGEISVGNDCSGYLYIQIP